MKYETKKLNECCSSISDGDHLPPPKADSGVPFVTISDIDPIHNVIDFSNAMYVSDDYYQSLHTIRKAQPGDILYTVVGSFGIPILIREQRKFVFQRHIAILRPDPRIVLPEFLYYTMKTKSFYAQADAYAVGSAQRTIGLGSLRKMKITVPSIDKQREIISALSPYDSLIEINKQRIEILEDMAENLYKEWFVRFRFPGCLNNENDGVTPAGWNTTRFSEVYKCIRGVSYSSEEIECEEGNNLINLKNIQAFGGFRPDGTKKYSGQYRSDQYVTWKDLVMGVTDMTQDRRTVGAVALIPRIDGVISADLIKLQSKINNVFSYCMFRWGYYSTYISQFGNGSNVIHLKPGAIRNMKMLIPSTDVIEAFAQKAEVIIEKIDYICEQNNILAKQRDLLIPRLMNIKN